MKKFLLVFAILSILALLSLTLSITTHAELIDGPANIRETPNGAMIFSLNDDCRVQCKTHDEKWFYVSFTAWVKGDGVVDGKQIKKDVILYDYSGIEIGKTLSTVTLGKSQKSVFNSDLKLYSCSLGGYTFKNNIQTIIREKAQLIAARFHENSRNPAKAIPNSKKDLTINGITYYYFEIVFERGTAAEVLVNGKTGDVHGYDPDSYENQDKVMGSISQALETNAIQARTYRGEAGTPYQNHSLGIGFSIPKSWEGKYRIEATDESITVYFLPKEKAGYDNAGMLFTIVKRSKDVYESMLDGLGKRYIKAKNVIYVVGGPTDVNFPDNHKEFKDFLEVHRKVLDVVATIDEN
jgi:hypothetical protein